MSDYRTFTGESQLDQLKQRQDRGQLHDDDKTILMILDLAGLDLSTLVKQGTEQNREQRQFDLDDAGVSLTKDIEDRWNQRKYEVQFRADGQQFYTFVKDEKDPSLIQLSERSKGFQWFFSFDLLFMYETAGTFKNCVLLLDEPGLHLHPSAQQDLLKRLEHYAHGNRLIYTTHLPFMVDLRKPERIRILDDKKDGTVVTTNLYGGQADSKLVLQAALGMSASNHFLISKKNLVVEGVDDYWFLTELANLFARSEKAILPDDIFISPANGASEAAYLTTFMIGQKLQVFSLFDSDDAGRTAKDKLVKGWLTHYSGNKASAYCLGDILGSINGDMCIEDLFTEEFYIRHFLMAYEKELKAAGIDKVVFQGKDPIHKRAERFATGAGIQFGKGSIAKKIRSTLCRTKSINELPPETTGKAEKLLNFISKSLEIA